MEDLAKLLSLSLRKFTVIYNIKQGKLNTKRSVLVSNNDYKMKQCSVADDPTSFQLLYILCINKGNLT